MNPDRLEDNVPLFVLGELEGLELATFEMALARDDALQAAVHQDTETFASLATRAAGTAEPPPAIWAAIEHRVRPASSAPSVREMPLRRALPPWFWPAAAALLLALNLAQWFWPGVRDSFGAHDPSATASSADARRRAGERERSGSASKAGDELASGKNSTDESASRVASDDAQQRAAADRALAEDYRKLQADYARLSQLVLPLLDAPLVDTRNARVWIAEMREKAGDEASAAIGLWDRARELAPQHGVAVLPDRWRLAGGVVVNPEMFLRPGGPGVTTSVPSPSDPAPATFAMALLNSAEGLGYLDLYNLPTVPTGTEMKVWLKNEGDAGYTDVGVVPRSLVGGSGALVFRVPQFATNQAQRVLITIEPQAPRSQPTGPTIIEGP